VQEENYEWLPYLAEGVGKRCVGRDPMSIPVAVLIASGHPPRETRRLVGAFANGADGDVLGLEGIRRHKDIRRYCQRCVENDAEVRRCTTINCPFWPYRMGRNPHNPRRGRNPFVETRPEPPPEKANAAPTGRKGGAAKKKIKKDKRHPAYRPRPCLLQVGRDAR
jgi:hypothetical protein